MPRTGSHKNAFFKGQHRKEFAWFSLGASSPLVSMDADHAACQILDAVRNRRPELTITIAARLASIVQALLPNVTADLMKLTTRLLPRTPIPPKNETYTGWESGSTLSPSCSRELLIEQRSYTMGSEIILCHGEPLESRFGSFASMRIESGDSRQERGQPTCPLHSGG